MSKATLSTSEDTRNTIEVRYESRCSCDDECECSPVESLTFVINGLLGHGGGELVQDSPASSPYFDCNFMGYKFKATDDFDAREKIRKHLVAFKNIEFF